MTEPTTNRLLDGNLLIEALHSIFAIEFLKLYRSVLIKELINREIATTDFDMNLVSFTLYRYTSLAKFVHSSRLSQEHYLKLLSIRIVIDILGELFVDRVIINRDIDSNPRLKLHDVCF